MPAGRRRRPRRAGAHHPAVSHTARRRHGVRAGHRRRRGGAGPRHPRGDVAGNQTGDRGGGRRGRRPGARRAGRGAGRRVGRRNTDLPWHVARSIRRSEGEAGAGDSCRPGRRDGRPCAGRPPRRGLWGDRRAGGLRPPRAIHRDAQRRAVADLLPVRLGRTAEGVARDGGGRRCSDRHLPLAHRHRGLSEPHGHLVRRRARCSLRAGVDPRSRAARAAQLPHPRRRCDGGTRHNRREPITKE